MKIGIIGDMHLKEHLGYYDHVKDSRVKEFNDILKFIVSSLDDCDSIVFLGDNFDKKNNPSIVIKKFVEFIEMFGNKKLYFLGGNHDRGDGGKTAIDFIGEIKNKNWTIITNEIKKINGMIFVPFFSARSLGVTSCKEATRIVEDKIKSLGDGVVFAHLSLSGAKLNGFFESDLLHEIVLNHKKIKNKIFAGHIHDPQELSDNAIIVGSVFNNDVSDNGKYIYKISDNGETEKISLPGRKIIKIENPTIEDLNKLLKHNIVKAIFTNKKYESDEIIEELKKFDGYSIVRIKKDSRKKDSIEFNNLIDMSIDDLLIAYCKKNKIKFLNIKDAFNLIKK